MLHDFPIDERWKQTKMGKYLKSEDFKNIY